MSCHGMSLLPSFSDFLFMQFFGTPTEPGTTKPGTTKPGTTKPGTTSLRMRPIQERPSLERDHKTFIKENFFYTDV
jgi:hypothetical protein